LFGGSSGSFGSIAFSTLGSIRCTHVGALSFEVETGGSIASGLALLRC
jgi:hypothetical protein